MQTFSDGTKTWHIKWTVGVCRDVQGMEYLDAEGQTQKLNPGLLEVWFPALYTNPVLVCDLVWQAARRQHLDRTREHLEEVFTGELIETCREALLDEVLNFIKSQASRYRLMQAMRSQAKIQLEKSYAEIESQLTGTELPLSAQES